jgi:hypothetical protein
MPRNSARLSNKTENKSNPEVTENKSSIFDFVTPTDIVDLPTKGRFYPEDHPLHNQESIEIRHMTAKDTDILTSKSLLKKGIAVERMLENVIVDKDINLDDLYVGDKNALIVASRINGFGPEYRTKVRCPNCDKTSEHSFDLESINTLEEIEDIEISDNGTFVITLPKSKVEVECKLLTGKDEKLLAKTMENRKRLKLPENLLTEQYKIFIVSLNGETERGLVEKFIEVMPALDATHLRKMYEKVVPNVDMTHDFVCSSCETESVIDMPFSADFFWPN